MTKYSLTGWTVYLFLPPQQHPLLNQLPLQLQTLVQGLHLALHVGSLPLSQIPRGKNTHTYKHTHTLQSRLRKTLTTPAKTTEMVQSNFFEGPQCSRKSNVWCGGGINRRVNKDGGAWCSVAGPNCFWSLANTIWGWTLTKHNEAFSTSVCGFKGEWDTAVNKMREACGQDEGSGYTGRHFSIAVQSIFAERINISFHINICIYLHLSMHAWSAPLPTPKPIGM